MFHEGRTRHDRVTASSTCGSNELLLNVRNKPYDRDGARGRISFERSNPIDCGQAARIEVKIDGLGSRLRDASRAAVLVTRNYRNANCLRGFPDLSQEKEIVHQSDYGRGHGNTPGNRLLA